MCHISADTFCVGSRQIRAGRIFLRFYTCATHIKVCISKVLRKHTGFFTSKNTTNTEDAVKTEKN